MHVESEDMDDGRRERVERRSLLWHRSAEGEPMDRTVDWFGTADARRGARVAHPTGCPLHPQGVSVRQARQACHCLRGRHRTARAARQWRSLQPLRLTAHAHRLSQDGALQHLRHHVGTEGEECHRHHPGQRSPVSHATEQALQSARLRTSQVSHQHPDYLCGRHHEAHFHRREVENHR